MGWKEVNAKGMGWGYKQSEAVPDVGDEQPNVSLTNAAKTEPTDGAGRRGGLRCR